jgi:hypothetical protein
MDDENPGAGRERTVGFLAERPARSRIASHARSRWVVHLGLLASFVGAFATLQLLHIHNAIHAVVGLVFAGLVIVHLAQRRHRIARMFAQLTGLRPRLQRELGLLASDAILMFITINVVVSGILDWGRGEPFLLPLPMPFQRWHLTSSAVLVVYLAVHVIRRRKRIRRSTVR